jgi:hypothetical protein
MSKRSKQKGGAAATVAPLNLALATTGSARRDKETQALLSRLLSRVPLLQSNVAARDQLTSIVFGGLRQLREQEDRQAELCDTTANGSGGNGTCSLCNWTAKAHCECCGTDFTRIRAGASVAPLFIPVYAKGKLHVDICMLCSQSCIERMMEQKEKLQQEKETAASTAGAGGTGSAAASSSSTSSSVRLTRSAGDPQHSTASLLFHVLGYAWLLWSLMSSELSVASLVRSPLGWGVLLVLASFFLWLLNLMLTCASRGALAPVFRLRQALSATTSIASVAAASTLAGVALAMFTDQQGRRGAASEDSLWQLLSQIQVVVLPPLLCALDVAYFPHVKLSRTFERTLCVMVPAIVLAGCAYLRLTESATGTASSSSSAQAQTEALAASKELPLPDLLFGMDGRTSSAEELCTYAAAALALLLLNTLTFQRLRDRAWSQYAVPKHLRLD